MYGFEMNHISKRFGAVTALRDVSFAARPGTVHALCGENGAGKSVLTKILAGVYRPDSGELFVQGNAVSFSSPADAVRAGVSMLYQESDLALDLTVTENIFLGAERLIGGKFVQVLDTERMHREADDMIDCHGFMLKPDTVVSELTPAKRQQVEILKALNRKAQVLVMDEPTASLSLRETQELFAIIRELRNSGMTIVYISHRLDEVLGIADEVTVLRDGVRVYFGARSAVNAERVVRLMAGGDPEERFPGKSNAPGGVFFEAKDISDHAGRVRKATFHLRRGEIVGLAGLVGSGRSETAELISGVAPLASGAFLLNGKHVEFDSPAGAVACRIALVPDDRAYSGVIPALSGSANLLLPNYRRFGMRFTVPRRRELRLGERFGRFLGLGWPSPRTPGGRLSAGTMRKILIGRWLLSGAQLLILDEPTRGVDVESRREIYELMIRFVRRGRTILLIPSSMGELFGMTDRILVMRNGRMAGDLNTKETTREEVMRLAAVDSL
ncbi:MAG: sugar ABC transporter ATP-binding protein [Lentisphaeria bacterium]|nr:sugar ABC transporter ATP-binding protein [Lentisphaeria bacterium]